MLRMITIMITLMMMIMTLTMILTLQSLIHKNIYLSRIPTKNLAKQMSQDNVAIFLIERIAKDFTRAFDISS